jgi:protein-histidine pros-kinase
MRLITKFSLVFALVFGIGLGVAGVVARGLLQRSAREQVLYQAQVMMEMALAMRDYTSNQVKPVIYDLQKLAEVPATEVPPKKVFRPQTVPAYSATEIFNYLRRKYPDYFYKEAALNPTNPRDRAADWEEDLIKVFRAHPELAAFDGERMTPFGRALYLARPMRAAKGCLECHSTPAEAPQEMVHLYGPANGFGWREQDVIAAQVVSVPVSLPVAIAERGFKRLMIYLVAVAVVTLLAMNLVLFLTVIRPVSRLAAVADDVSKGNLDVPELPAKGGDEISVLASAFNRMRRSLSAAMQFLEKP